VTLVGDTAADVLLFGLPQELPVERELVADRMELTVGGSAAITSHNLAALGTSVGFITPRADDLFGAMCQQRLQEAGVDLSRCVPSSVPTGLTVMMQYEAQRRALTYPGNGASLRFEDLDFEYLCNARHFHLSSYFLQRELRADIPRLFARLKQAGLTISLDTNDDPWNEWPSSIAESLHFVDILMPNSREACRLACVDNLDDAIEQLRPRVPILVIKRGAAGASVFHKDFHLTLPGVPIDFVDAVGAGDSFNAGFLAAYVRDQPIAKCLHMGNLAGALSATRLGGTTAFRDESILSKLFQELDGTVI
jgi:sugar/nucleoside kinase (ribokinase family)